MSILLPIAILKNAVGLSPRSGDPSTCQPLRPLRCVHGFRLSRCAFETLPLPLLGQRSEWPPHSERTRSPHRNRCQAVREPPLAAVICRNLLRLVGRRRMLATGTSGLSFDLRHDDQRCSSPCPPLPRRQPSDGQSTGQFASHEPLLSCYVRSSCPQ